MFLRNREDAEDALQDVLMRLWSNRQQLDTYQSVEALAVQMTKNLCLDRLKAHSRQKSVIGADLSGIVTQSVQGIGPNQPEAWCLLHDIIGRGAPGAAAR